MMTFALPNMVTLGGVNLTDESRSPVAIDIDQRVSEKQLASGKKIKFLLENCSKFSMSWENVASSASTTVDGCGGRDEIKALAFSGTTQTLVLHYLGGTTVSYTVFIDSYQEEIVMRRASALRYRISLGLEEQG